MYWTFSESYAGGVLVFTTVFLLTYLLWTRRRRQADNLPPALRWLPIVGSLPFMAGFQDLPCFLMKTSKTLGSVFALYSGSQYVVVLNGRQAIHEALVVKSVDFADRRTLYAETLLNPELKGLISRRYNSDFRKYHQLMSSLLRQLGYGKRIMETRILTEVKDLVCKVQDFKGGPFDPNDVIMSSVANVLLSVVFGRRCSHDDAGFQEFITDNTIVSTYATPELDIFRALRFLPYYQKAIKKWIAYTARIMDFLNSHASICLQEERKTESFVMNLAEASGRNFDMEDLKFLLRDIFCAGVETTTHALRWAIALLTNHPDVQSQLHAEIDSIIGRERPPMLEDRQRMPYAEATLLELMRCKTGVPLALFHVTTCDTQVSGYSVPAETVVIVNLYSAHMDPDVWNEPEQFMPERFIDDRGNVTGKERAIPFSLGKRACFGKQLARQQLFLFLVGLLQQFEFRPPEGQDHIDVHDETFILNSPSHFDVRFVPRRD